MRSAAAAGVLCLALACWSTVGLAGARAAYQTGCRQSTPDGSSVLSLEVGGHARTANVHVPGGYRGNAEVPLVLNLHGSGSRAEQQEKFSGMDSTADARGFVVAYPQALIPEGSGFDWNVPGADLVGGKPVPRGAPDDVAFITRLVVDLEQRYCIDPHRVYATGFSGGARLTSQLACDDSRLFAAVAPVSGLRDPTPCSSARPVSIIAFHGTADPIDPYSGHGQAYWTYSVRSALSGWARKERCASAPLSSRPASSVDLTRYAGCKDGATVELYTIVGEGHEWPGGPTLPAGYTAVLGPQSHAIDADSTMWAFFAQHTLP